MLLSGLLLIVNSSPALFTANVARAKDHVVGEAFAQQFGVLDTIKSWGNVFS